MSDYLIHHGILGQKWGIRRYQNADGSLTPEGEKRYGAPGGKGSQRRLNDLSRAVALNKQGLSDYEKKARRAKDLGLYEQEKEYRKIASRFKSNIKDGEKEIAGIIKKLESGNYVVTAKDSAYVTTGYTGMSDARKAKAFIASWTGVIGALLLTDVTEGKKYKVR